MQTYLGPARATQIAANFFGQYHSDMTIKEVVRDGNVWVVTILYGLINKQYRQVRINAKTGMILGFQQIAEKSH